MHRKFDGIGPKTCAFIICLGFYITISLPILQTVFHLSKDYIHAGTSKRISESPVAGRPILGWIHNYRLKCKNYFDENSEFRKALVKANSLIHIRLLNVSPSPRAILGKQSWLFYDDPLDGISLRDFRGLAQFTTTDLQKARDRAVQVKEALARKGVKLLIVIAPNKHTIYPEYLPNYSSDQHRRALTRLDQVLPILRENGLHVIDLRSVLSGKKHYGPLYSRTDTHWNPLGAFIAYEEIMSAASAKGLDVHSLKLSQFQVAREETLGRGDIATILGANDLLKDEDVTLKPRSPFTTGDTPRRQHYGAGQEAITPVTEGRCKAKLKLVMFGDSFSLNLRPYLSQSFWRSVHIMQNDEIDLAIIDNEKPDLVIWEMVERYLGRLCNGDKN